MDNHNGRRQNLGDDQYIEPYSGRNPRPRNAPPLHTSGQPKTPPRPYQHRPAPGYTHSRPPAAHAPRQPEHRIRPNHGQEERYGQPQYARYPAYRAPPPIFEQSGRHLSHISALSSPQAAFDSRPVSEIHSLYPGGPPVDHIHGQADADTNGFHRHVNSSGVSQASLGTKSRHAPTAQDHQSRLTETSTDSQASGSEDQVSTMQALTAAIQQGLGPSAPRSTTAKPLADHTRVRMPFQGEPGSPTSTYTDMTVTQKRQSVPVSTYQGFEAQESRPSTITEHDVDDFEKPMPTPGSFMSTTPIVQDEQAGMSSRIPAGKRPPQLDMSAVREAEARGSMSSLSDLIRRATKLASNLDRGKTASRLGHLDMFGSSEKLGNSRLRDSTYSDVLNAFPSPSGTPGKHRPGTLWPSGERQFMASKSSLGRVMDSQEEKPRRKCCGMSPPLFVLVLIIVILLVAAAVLVPVFLIVLPKQRHHQASGQCSASFTCHNGGIKVSATNICSCVCVNGFTGNDCSVGQDPECITASVEDGSRTYGNATVGGSVLPILQKSQDSFGIMLNATNILSIFASNNLSCASENSLVDFGTTNARTKRFIVVPGMMSPEPFVPALNLPPSESDAAKRFVIIDGLEPAVASPQLGPTRTIQARQDPTQSANGIVFAGSSSTASATSSTGPTGTASTSTATASAAPSSAVNATDSQLDFAATVVLYVLQSNPGINVAVSANQALSSYLGAGSAGNNTINVVGGSEAIRADFDTFQIIFANGTRIGSKANS